jgi:DNA-binding response OmpR family regulator
MPDINGLELVSFVKINDAYRNVPLIIVSTENSERDRTKGLELGVNAYIVKRFELQDLRDLINRLFRSVHSLNALASMFRFDPGSCAPSGGHPRWLAPGASARGASGSRAHR